MFRRARFVTLAALLAGFTLAAPARAAWEATADPLGRDKTRLMIHAGVGWTGISGSDVNRVEPGPSLEAGLGFRVLGSVSLYAGYSTGSFDVNGQLVQLLGQNVRADGRSGNVVGTYEPQRIRLGIRFNGLRTETHKVIPYFGIGALLTTATVKLDTVDGEPAGEVPLTPGSGDSCPVGALCFEDLSNFSRDKIGGYFRGGFAWRVASLLSIYADGIYEVVEFPPGLNAMASANAGLRLHF